jgi:hypothetical protein
MGELDVNGKRVPGKSKSSTRALNFRLLGPLDSATTSSRVSSPASVKPLPDDAKDEPEHLGLIKLNQSMRPDESFFPNFFPHDFAFRWPRGQHSL